MAVRDINLIPEKERLSPEELRRRDTIKRVTVLTTCIVVLLLAVVFGVSYWLNQQVEQVDREIATQKTKIKTLEKSENTYMLLKQKASALKTILGSHYDYPEIFSYFKGIEQKGGLITTIGLNEAGNVTISVVVADSAALDSYINELLVSAEKKFSRIEMNGLQFNPTGSFTVSFSIETRGVAS